MYLIPSLCDVNSNHTGWVNKLLSFIDTIRSRDETHWYGAIDWDGESEADKFILLQADELIKGHNFISYCG